jgi:cytochrome c6
MRRLKLVPLLAVATALAAGSALAADDGKSLYETKCALCHGKDGVAKPAGKGSRNFNDPAFQSAMSADAIVAMTTEGKGKMPAYRSTLKPDQVRAIAAHVKTLGAAK